MLYSVSHSQLSAAWAPHVAFSAAAASRQSRYACHRYCPVNMSSSVRHMLCSCNSNELVRGQPALAGLRKLWQGGAPTFLGAPPLALLSSALCRVSTTARMATRAEAPTITKRSGQTIPTQDVHPSFSVNCRTHSRASRTLPSQ